MKAALLLFFAICIFSPAAFYGSDLIPFTYSHSTPFPLAPAEAEKARSLGKKDIDAALDNLLTDIPEFPSWVARSSIPGNANSQGARQLRILSDKPLSFSREQVDALLTGLDHVDQGVRYDVEIALTQIFALNLVESGPGWTHEKDPAARKPYLEAWRHFWKTNRDRYGTNRPYILNDLSLEAVFERPGELKVSISNHGTRPVQIWMMAGGKFSSQDELKQFETEIMAVHDNSYPLKILMDGKSVVPQYPRELIEAMGKGNHTDPVPLHREMHIAAVEVLPGKRSDYLLNLEDAFPGTRFSGKTIILQYSYGPWRPARNSYWRGELQSGPVSIP